MSDRWKLCCTALSQRWICVIMTFMSLFCAYTVRVCLSIAITEMVRQPAEAHRPELADDTCPVVVDDPESGDTASSNFSTRQHHDPDLLYDWDEPTQGLILSSFYWGYVVSHIPGGMVAERFGGKHTLGLGIAVNSLLTLLTPWGVGHGGAYALFALRALVGLAQGAAYPALNVMLAQWVPQQERARAGSLVFAGAPLGTVFATLTSGLLLRYCPWGWPVVFYFFGGLGLAWYLLWCILCYNSPEQHPFISAAEAKYLHEQLSGHKHARPPRVPWRHVLASAPVSDLPKYMSSVLRFDVENNGYLSSLPYLCMWLGGITSSWLTDWLLASGRLSTTNVRKLGNSLASVGPALFIVAASYAGCDRRLVVAMMALGMTTMGAALPSMKVNGLDLSPNYSGSLMALTNGLGSLAGIACPLIVGLLTPHQTLSEWRLVFWIICAVFMLTNLVFVLWADGEVQFWNDPDFLRREKSERRTTKASAKLDNQTREAHQLLSVRADPPAK
ncbi:hypothetical protein QAD02_017196 [Eretmocerus hayati]|uniref:Uncharacterized protein n=1 Tax=Eretmocerus hayati TaxID=131215 RepID=A0ACC2PFS9_9HYME|nr:hypothetical protein QAD02_017196 [Eretmocerus hayati]